MLGDSDPFCGRVVGPFTITARKIGSGCNGDVRIAVHKDGSQSAVKIVNNNNTKFKDEALREINLLHGLQHDNIIQLRYFGEDDQFIYTFTELMEEGDLYTYMKRNGVMTETQAFRMFKHMISALQFCHENRICHHDFKLENCVLGKDMLLKVIDFGYAVQFISVAGQTQLISKYCGSPAYSAPEILTRKPHNETVDIFSVGVCLYYMLTGAFPFCDEQKTTYEQLLCNLKTFCLDFPTYMSTEAKELITRMLQKQNRISWAEVRQSAWFKREKKKVIVATLFADEP